MTTRLSLALPFLLMLTTGCLAVSEMAHVPSPTPAPQARADCGEIMGTAFRSDAEREWFSKECSAWTDRTLGAVTPTPKPEASATPPANRNDDTHRLVRERCDRMRGQLYDSREQRVWYQQNCEALGGGDAAATDQATPVANRADCTRIRGTEYRSNQERDWYRANCR